MALLNGVLSLHDVRDVEKLCRHVLEPFRGRIRDDAFDDALTYLVEVCWRLSERYDERLDGARPSFASYAADILDRRVHEWARSRYRTRWVFRDTVYERARPVVLSLDAPAGGGDDGVAFGELLAVHDRVSEADRDSDGLVGLLRDRARCRAGDLDALCQGLLREAAA